MCAIRHHIPMEVISHPMIACATHDIPFSWRLYHTTCLHGCHVVPNSYGGYTTSHAAMGTTCHHIPMEVVPQRTLPWVPHSRGCYTTSNTFMGATRYLIPIVVIPHHTFPWVTHGIPFPCRLYHIIRFHGCHMAPYPHGGYTT